MLSLAYSISAELKDKLTSANQVRVHLLTAPLLPKTERKLHWDTMIQRLYGSLTLAGNPLTKTQIINLLIKHPKKLHPEEREVIAYKQALNNIDEQWTGNPKPVETRAVAEIIALVAPGTKDSALRQFRLGEEKVKQLLNYLQTQGDHPLIQGAIAHYYLITNPPFSDDRGRTARLLNWLFLAKFGYNVNGLAAPECIWRQTEESYRRAYETSFSHGALTPFIHYVVNAYISNLEQTMTELAASGYRSELATSAWELNDRQQAILAKLENPETAITNRQVQKLYQISQITASRDLAKLATLGLVYAHGRGRSVYYTKV